MTAVGKERDASAGASEPGRRAFRRAKGERGDSLAEVVVAVTLLGTAFVAILYGLSTVSITATRHNEVVLLESALSQAKQAIATQAFVSVPGATCTAVYSLPTVTGVTLQQCVTPVSGPEPLQLQEVKIHATGATTTRVAVVFKGQR